MKAFFISLLAKVGSSMISAEATRGRTTAIRLMASVLVAIAYTAILILLLRQV